MNNTEENLNQGIIDVLIVIDAETILEKFPDQGLDPLNPVQVTDADLIFMTTKEDNKIKGSEGNELTVKARTLDVIRWRETTLSLNAAFSSILYQFVFSEGKELISKPEPLLITVDSPLPNDEDPTKPTTQNIQNYFWNSTVKHGGHATYHFNFMILDRDGKILGYYFWDPFIQISE